MTNGCRRRSIAVRLEGGLGDHLLGMRVLSFVRARFPEHDILLYSDSAGHETQLQIAEMSPVATQVTSVLANGFGRTIGDLCEADRQAIRESDVFIDAWGGAMFLDAALKLDVPVFDILASRPQLSIPPYGEQAAQDFLGQLDKPLLVGLNLTKYDAVFLARYDRPIFMLLSRLLEERRVVILNFFTSNYNYSHWKEPERTTRNRMAFDVAAYLRDLCTRSDRIHPCVDLPLSTVSALLRRCCYFIGVDNGIKHLAWALNVPLTFFHPILPALPRVVRWIPDLHRMLLFDCPDAALVAHVRTAIAAVSGVNETHAITGTAEN